MDTNGDWVDQMIARANAKLQGYPDPQIMRPGHPYWDYFMWRLAGPDMCNFQEDSSKELGFTWNCSGTVDRPYTNQILDCFIGLDKKASLDFLSTHGGKCDCEVVLNVPSFFEPFELAFEELDV